MYFIDPAKAYTWFSSNFSLKKTSNQWYAFKCPFCAEIESRTKCAVNFQYGYTKCWVCGYKEHVVDFVKDYEGVKLSDARYLLQQAKPSKISFDSIVTDVKSVSAVELPVGYHSILDGKNILGDRARAYLENRGFDLHDLDRMGIGYCFHEEEELAENEDYFGYIIIPFKNRGKLLYYIGRDYIGNFLRYKNPPKDKVGVGKGDLLFNQDALDIFDECYLTEGWADALTMGRSGVSTQGWSFSTRQKKAILQSSCERLVFVPDGGSDNTGDSFYKKAILTAMEYVDYKEVMVLDLNLIGAGKDANEIGKKDILYLKENTELLDVGKATEILINL